MLIQDQSNKNEDVKLEVLERALRSLEPRREEYDIKDTDWMLDYKKKVNITLNSDSCNSLAKFTCEYFGI